METPRTELSGGRTNLALATLLAVAHPRFTTVSRRASYEAWTVASRLERARPRRMLLRYSSRSGGIPGPGEAAT